ncbi:MAG: GIY-YIG nuclease family protein [Alphaproteobacteria bacterium]
MSDLDLDELRSELDDFAQPEKKGGRSPREERIIAGFEEIQRFVEEHGRAPQHGEDRDIFERLYAVRLDRIRALEECRSLLAPLDHQGLLEGGKSTPAAPVEEMDDDELLAELGGAAGASEITELRHVRSSAEKRAAEEIANRTKCEDFDHFKPLFVQVKKELDAGVRQTRPFQTMAEIKQGEFFIVGGQIAYIAELGEEFITQYDRRDSRLRVIYDNGTESDVLLRSLQRALHRDEAGRRITDPAAGPLFAGKADDGDLASGTIYVVRSMSDHPVVAANRDVLHKIGVTGGDVLRRIANAKLDPTFLLADVEIIATYELYNINRSRLENLIHRIFDRARLSIEIKDRFGNPFIPREWFLVPLYAINEAVERIKDGTITDYVYDPNTAKLAMLPTSRHRQLPDDNGGRAVVSSQE